MLNVCSLSKSYQNNIILKDVSFHLNASDIGIVIGKSGAGKSTLLRCLVGLESFDTGEITINGTSIQSSNDFKCIQSQVGFVFQNFNLFPNKFCTDHKSSRYFTNIYNDVKPRTI